MSQVSTQTNPTQAATKQQKVYVAKVVYKMVDSKVIQLEFKINEDDTVVCSVIQDNPKYPAEEDYLETNDEVRLFAMFFSDICRCYTVIDKEKNCNCREAFEKQLPEIFTENLPFTNTWTIEGINQWSKWPLWDKSKKYDYSEYMKK